MTPHSGKQTITIHILSSISRSKGNQTMKFGELMKYNVKKIFLKNHTENETGRRVPNLFFFFKKALKKSKLCMHLSLNIFR